MLRKAGSERWPTRQCYLPKNELKAASEPSVLLPFEISVQQYDYDRGVAIVTSDSCFDPVESAARLGPVYDLLVVPVSG